MMSLLSRPFRVFSTLGAASLAVALSTSATPASAEIVNDIEAGPQSVSEATDTQGGRFDQVMDLVHIDFNPWEASVHGWWQDPNKNFTGKKAKVVIELQYKSSGKWKTVAKGSKAAIKPGGGRGKRANARTACQSSDNGTWRSKVDVDVAGVIDAPIKTTSPEQVRPCSI